MHGWLEIRLDKPLGRTLLVSLYHFTTDLTVMGKYIGDYCTDLVPLYFQM